MAEPAMSVSNSEIQTFLHCRRRWWLSYYRRLRPLETSLVGPLPLGSRVHKALELHYKSGADLVGTYLGLLQADYATALSNGDDITALESEGDLGRIMLEGFIDWAAEEGLDSLYEVVGIEEVLTMPMLDGQVEVKGKIDIRVRDKRDGTHLLRDWKHQPVDEVVLTPQGWREMGDLQPGDHVIGSRWQSSEVLEVFDAGDRDVYRINFTDGTSVRASDEHLWPVMLRHEDNRVQVMETKQIINWAASVSSGYKANIYIKNVEPDRDETRREPLPVDPYALGAWLANGSSNAWQITDGAEDARVLEAVGVRNMRSYAGRESALVGLLPEGMTAGLRNLGLAGTRSIERWIPDQYLRACYSDRLALMHGLMDSDGGMSGKGARNTIYYTSSQQLADGVALLSRSLGWRAQVWRQEAPRYSYRGELRTGAPCYRISLRADVPPFLHNMKSLDAWVSGDTYRSTRRKVSKAKRIATIEYVGKQECRCIRIDADDSLYVTAGGVLTHNTVAQSATYSKWAHMNPQLLTYQTLDFINTPEEQRIAGGQMMLLRKVKRGPRAKPPFYELVDIRHNVFTLRSFWVRLQRILRDMLATRQALDSGTDPALVVYPTPSRDCSWICPFYAACPLFDDGSGVEDLLSANFAIADDVYDYYQDEKEA